MANPSTLFPKIGDIASSTDEKVDADPSDNQEGDGDEKIIQEIESLCMRCHEQVSNDPTDESVVAEC
jgi:zinc finger protein